MATNIDNGCVAQFDAVGDPTSIGTRWLKWVRGFRRYAGGKGVKEHEQKLNLLLHCAGEKVQDIYDILIEREEANAVEVPVQAGEGAEAVAPVAAVEDSCEKAIKLLTKHFSPQINVTYERHLFRQMQQQEGETIDQYVTRLQDKTKFYEFKDKNEQIRDQVIQTCRSHHLRRKLLEKSKDLTVHKLQEVARSCEAVEQQMQVLKVKPEVVMKVDVKEARNKPPRQTKNSKGQGKTKKNSESFRCGGEGHEAADPKCPAKEQTCNKCGLKGHFAKKCKTKETQQNKRQQVHYTQEQENEADEYTFHISSEKVTNHATLSVGGVQIKMLVDSGSSMDIIFKELWEELKQKHVKCKTKTTSTKKLYTYGAKTPLPLRGIFTALFKIPGREIEADVAVLRCMAWVKEFLEFNTKIVISQAKFDIKQ